MEVLIKDKIQEYMSQFTSFSTHQQIMT